LDLAHSFDGNGGDLLPKMNLYGVSHRYHASVWKKQASWFILGSIDCKCYFLFILRIIVLASLGAPTKPIGDALTCTGLRDEFRNDAELWSTEPTAVISMAKRVTDTIRCAFDEYYTFTDGELPADGKGPLSSSPGH
jgi:hypothetical protein